MSSGRGLEAVCKQKPGFFLFLFCILCKCWGFLKLAFFFHLVYISLQTTQSETEHRHPL